MDENIQRFARRLAAGSTVFLAAFGLAFALFSPRIEERLFVGGCFVLVAPVAYLGFRYIFTNFISAEEAGGFERRIESVKVRPLRRSAVVLAGVVTLGCGGFAIGAMIDPEELGVATSIVVIIGVLCGASIALGLGFLILSSRD